MLYIIAYKDELGNDFYGLPWLIGLTESKEEILAKAQECRKAKFKDVTIFSTDEKTIERMENISWEFVNENKVEEPTLI